MFGFIVYIMNQVNAILGLIGSLKKSIPVAMCTSLFTCILIPSFLAFLVSGMVLRWRHVGRVCTGSFEGTPEDTNPIGPEDYVYMKSTGNFMHWYLLITAIFTGICLLGTCCLICFLLSTFGAMFGMLFKMNQMNRTANSLNI